MQPNKYGGGLGDENKKMKKWEANYNDYISKYKDLDISTAHKSETSKLVE